MRNVRFHQCSRALLFIQALVFLSVAYGAQGGSDRQILEALNQGYLEAYQTGNTAFFDRVLAESFRETAPDGTILDREEFLEKISGRSAPQSGSIRAGELEIRVLGDTAIIHAIPVVTMPGGSTANGGRYTDVYSRMEGQWRCVAAHLGAS